MASKGRAAPPAGREAVPAGGGELAAGARPLTIDGAAEPVVAGAAAGQRGAAAVRAQDLEVAAPVDHQVRVQPPDRIAARDGDRGVGFAAAGGAALAGERGLPARA